MILLENLRFHVEEEGKGLDNEGQKVMNVEISLVCYFGFEAAHIALLPDFLKEITALSSRRFLFNSMYLRYPTWLSCGHIV